MSSPAPTALNMIYASPSMGKSCMAASMAMQLGLSSQTVIVMNGEAISGFPGVERAASLPHDPSHTALQCLAEGVRRVCVKLNKTDRLLFAGHVMKEIGIECDVFFVSLHLLRSLPAPSKPQSKWQQATHKEAKRKFVLKTALGYVDDEGHSGETLEALMKACKIAGRWYQAKYPMSAQDLLQTYNEGCATFKSWFNPTPYMSEEAHEELQLAWMQGQTARSHRSSAPRRI